jgi:hypothetical protein
MKAYSFHRAWLVAAVAGIALVGQAVPAARAAVVSLMPAQCNTLFGPNLAGNSMGAGQHISVGGTRKYRGLIEFDLSAIPSRSTISSATLTMYMDRASGSGGYQIYLHQVTSAWGAGTSHAPPGTDGYDQDLGIRSGGSQGVASTDTDANWSYRFYNAGSPSASIPWATAGGDCDPASSAVTSVGAGMSTSGMPPLQCVWQDAGMVADVQAWVDGADPNYGWLLKGDELTSTGDNPRRFMGAANWFNGSNPRMNYDSTGSIATDGSLTPDFRPVLVVDYVPAPEPVSLGLLGCGGLLLLTARRRPA